MKKIFILIFFNFPLSIYSQQIADTTFFPIIENPEYEIGKGPIVLIDQGHHNFHTKNGRFRAFSELLIRDGYNVMAYEGLFEKEKLSKGKILVISNALNQVNVGNWVLPNPSAFTESEILTVKNWVYEGGSLFLIADHMPMAGAAQDMAAAFGFEFTNGFAIDTTSRGADFFSINEKTLIENSITKGRTQNERVNQIATFTGQAMKLPNDATPILLFSNNFLNLLPERAWVFDENTEAYPIVGWSQGGYIHYGKGRVVAFGEAAMFTAQLAGPNQIKIGMNSDFAPENYKLLLNIIHWLDGKID